MSSLADFELRDEVYVPRAGDAVGGEYVRRWDDEAADDPLRSATARAGPSSPGYRDLTRKTSWFWRRFPAGRAFGTVLELGCGYGRVPLYLASERGFACERYFALDISVRMLEHFREHRRRHRSFPSAEVSLVRASADRVPRTDDSVDLVLPSGVIPHMAKRYVERALAEAARVLRPGGGFAFDASFPNALCPANAPFVLRGALPFGRTPHHLKYYTVGELRRLVVRSGLAGKAPGWRLASDSHALLPKTLRRVRVPLARRVNARLTGAPPALRRATTVTYTLYSAGLLDGPPPTLVAEG